MLINAFHFLSTFRSYRLLWIAGRFGGGKTSLAVRLAREFLEEDYRLITNIRCVWADDLEKMKLDRGGGDQLRAVVLLDEGGLDFKATRQVEEIASYAAKMDVQYIISSFWPPTRAAQVCIVQPLFNFVGIGIPLIVYRWTVNLHGFKDSGSFYWLGPEEVYGVYSRQDPGERGPEIVRYLGEKTAEYRGRHGRSHGLSSVEIDVSEAELLSDAAGALASAAGEWTAISSRKNKRGKF